MSGADGEARAPAVAIARLSSPDEAGRMAVSVDRLAADAFGDAAFSLVEELRRPFTRIFVASLSPEAAGSLAVGYLVAWHVADELHILHVAVLPDRRREGIGKALVRRAIDFAVAERLRLVLLEVRRSNRAAIGLYRSLGFSAMGVRPRYYADNGEDALEMMFELDPSTGERVPRPDEIRIDEGRPER